MQAVTRLEDGEALERVLADFPAAEREEMRELLTVVAATHHLQESAIPQPTQERRATNRRAFLQAASEMKADTAQQAETQPAALSAVNAATAGATTTTVTDSATGSTADAEPTLLQRLGWAWQEFLNSFTPLSTRLAPLALMLLVIWLASFRVVSVAQGAVPGDMVYPAKKWMLYQELVLAPEADRVRVYEKIENTLVADAKVAAERGVTVQENAELIYDGAAGGFLLIGEFAVTPQLLTSDIALDQLQEGDRVRLTYQLVPGDEGKTVNDRLVVQGISLNLIPDPVVIPATATPTATATATLTPTPRPTNTSVCSRWRPAGWVAYTIQSGDSLSVIARASGTTVGQLQTVNCITDANVLITNTNIWVPRLPIQETPAPLTTSDPDRMMTLTAVSTVVIEPSITVTSVTPTAVAISTTVSITPTVGISTAVTPQPTATPPVTITATVVQTTTRVPAELTPTVPVTVPTAATATPTPAATLALTGTAETTPTPELTAVPEATEPADATETVEATATQPVATETVDAATAVDTATAVATEEADTGETDTDELVTVTTTPGATASTSATTVTATPTPLFTPTAVPTFTPFPTGNGEVDGDGTAEGASSGGDNGSSESAATPTAIATVAIAPTATPTPTKPATGTGNQGGGGNNRTESAPTPTSTPARSSPLAQPG